MVIRMAAAAVGVALVVRVVKSRQRRFLHPAGRSFAGELETTWPTTARYPVTVRLSKGVGTRAGRADLRGVAIRVPLPGRDLDLLYSTAGSGRLGRHVPCPRRTFDTGYGTITPYRTGDGEKVYLVARPDPAGPPLGRTLAGLPAGGRLLLEVRRGATVRPAGRVVLGRPLPAGEDARLAFDPVRNSVPALHPTGLIHGVRAFAYRTSQRWRRVTPAPPNPAAVTRTGAHR